MLRRALLLTAALMLPIASALAATPVPQALLLEARDPGSRDAVPFSGTLVWSKGVDDDGQPTVVASARIPHAGLEADLIFRHNTDPSVPTSVIIEIAFSLSDAFTGGTIKEIPGILVKDEQLVQGRPIVGASARVVGTNFLFAISDAEEKPLSEVLGSHDFIDVAIVYGNDKRAVLTLSKDEAAEALFTEVIAAWAAAALPVTAAEPADALVESGPRRGD